MGLVGVRDAVAVVALLESLGVMMATPAEAPTSHHGCLGARSRLVSSRFAGCLCRVFRSRCAIKSTS